jgi:hypothetical protein
MALTLKVTSIIFQQWNAVTVKAVMPTYFVSIPNNNAVSAYAI